MFRKLVENLSFSPALVGQLGFYARRLRKEEMTRRIGLIFTAMALVVQSLVIFQPTQPANAASGNNIIYGGVRSKNDLLAIYDRNNDGAGHADIQQIYSYFGITRGDIERASQGKFNSKDFNRSIISAGRSTYDWQRTPHAIPNTNTTVYTSITADFDSTSWTIPNGSTYDAIIGTRAVDGKWFAIMMNCGNPAYITMPPPPAPPVTPTAVCSGLEVITLSRTSFKLKGQASTSGGASIKGYRYVIKSANGRQAFAQNIVSSSGASEVTADLPTSGNYSAELVVDTSLGDRSSADCRKALTVTPEPRCPLNPSLPESSPECKPCPDDSSLWYKDSTCKADYQLTKSVRNLSRTDANGTPTDANNTTARPGDRLEYTLEVKNVGKNTGTYTFKDNFADVLEYSDILQSNGGMLQRGGEIPVENQSSLVWQAMAIKPNQAVQKSVVVQVKTTIPAAPTNVSNPESYNCRMHNSFGNPTNVAVECPPEKTVEQVVTELPKTGPTESLLIGGSVLALVTYFYCRARQLGKEVRLIRRDVNAGTI